MKIKFSRLILFAGLIPLMCQTFAMVPVSENCPPAKMIIENSNFDKGVDYSTFGFWNLFDKKAYFYDGAKWNTMLYAKLPGVKTESEALEKGRLLYQNIKISDPVIRYGTCQYGGTDNAILMAYKN